MTEEGGGGGRAEEGAEGAAGLGVAWAFGVPTETPSLNNKRLKQMRTFPFLPRRRRVGRAPPPPDCLYQPISKQDLNDWSSTNLASN